MKRVFYCVNLQLTIQDFGHFLVVFTLAYQLCAVAASQKIPNNWTVGIIQ